MKACDETAAATSASGLPIIERMGDVLSITLNRPEQHNRLDPADINALQMALDGLQKELRAGCGATRALVLRGRGTRTFCSGFTLSAIGDQLDGRFERMLDSLESLPVPTIASIHGGVYGGGTDLALCCDIRLGVPETRMFMPAARFGIHYYPGGLRRYVHNLGLAASKKMFLTGLEIAASEMLRMGFLTEIVESSALEARVAEYLQAIGTTDSRVVASMKDHLRRIAEASPGLEASAQASRSSVQSEESRRRIAELHGPALRN